MGEETTRLKLALIVPCFNEESVLPTTSKIFLEKIEGLIAAHLVSEGSLILFVDDGSSDRTWALIEGIAASKEHVLGLKLSRNQGHQNALLAGLTEVTGKCDACISLDCDGQDDINAVDAMIEAYNDGFEVVYGVRSNRDSDSWFKKTSAHLFYKLMKAMGAEVVFDHADYRLLSARVLTELTKYDEVNLFVRGVIPLVGFNSTSVYYERHERLAGQSHYPFTKMLALAINGVTSLSVTPLRAITFLGLIGALLSFAVVCWSLIQYLLGQTVSGWTSIVGILSLLGSIQVLGVGVIGEYVGKIYLEVKRRPRFIVEKRTEREVKQGVNERARE